jgi:hypothetical protein
MTEQVSGTIYRDAPYKEGEVAAGASVTPGMGIEKTGPNPDGDPLVQPVSTVEPTGAQARFAREQRVPPRGEDGSMLDQVYDAGNHIEFRVYRRGDIVENALLAAGGDLATTSEATVTVGDPLAFNDDGSLKLATVAGAEEAQAREDVDNSGAAAGDRARISVEVL